MKTISTVLSTVFGLIFFGIFLGILLTGLGYLTGFFIYGVYLSLKMFGVLS